MPGNRRRITIVRALEARNVWMPYHTTAIRPRIIAGMLAPSTPNESRQITGNGTAAFWLGRAIKLAKICTIQIPTSSEISTCQPARPSANRLAATT